MKAGELAASVGINVQTLHYYERIGLLPRPARSAANYRIYSDESLRRVRFIKQTQGLGFTLAEIERIVALKSRGRSPCREVVEIGEKHLREVDARSRPVARLPKSARTITRRVAREKCQAPQLRG